MQIRPDLYPRIYSQAMQTQYGLTLFQLVQVDWSMMRVGVQTLSRKFSGGFAENMGAALACLRGDRSLTREMFQSLRYGQWMQFWPDPDAYNICQEWAFQAGVKEARSSSDPHPGTQDAANP